MASLPRVSVRQRAQKVPHGNNNSNQDGSHDFTRHVHPSSHSWTQSGRQSRFADWVIDDLGGNKVENGTGHQGRYQMCGKIVMQETLSIHEEEGKVVTCPSDHEESSVAQHPISDRWWERNASQLPM
jgi:hypothetical protein